MAGLDPTPPPPSNPEPLGRKSADSIESLLAESAPRRPSAADIRKDTGKESPAARRQSSNPPPKVRPPAPSFATDRQLQTAPSQVKKMQMSIGDIPQKKRGSSAGILVLMVLVLLGFAVALWLVKPGFLTGRTPEKIAAERAAVEAENARIAALRAQPACHATLVVTGAPKDSEILIREGQAPVDVDHMPMGTRLEFVATAEGYSPKRAIVPAEATWDSSSNKPHFDLPVQLDKSKARPSTVDSWPPGEPDTNAGGNGKPGMVHIISSPKGAEIWLLAGLGPEAKKGEPAPEVLIEDIVACDTDVDVLVAGPTTYRKRLHVPASSFTLDPTHTEPGGNKVAVRIAHIQVK
jgi:hypothetical protein